MTKRIREKRPKCPTCQRSVTIPDGCDNHGVFVAGECLGNVACCANCGLVLAVREGKAYHVTAPDSAVYTVQPGDQRFTAEIRPMNEGA